MIIKPATILAKQGNRPAGGAIVDILLPTGAQNVRGYGVRPIIELPMDWAIGPKTSCTLMPGIIYNSTDAKDRYWGPLASFLVTYSWTAQFGTFAEAAGQQFAAPRFGGNIITANAGATYLLTPNVQIDGSIWWGLNHDSPDAFYTAGLSFRR